MATTNIYILQLQGGKYYVGKSDNPTKRFQEHLDGNGSAWTRKYKPISIEKVIPNASSFDEDRYTKEYMLKHGIDNVRGGTYVQFELDEIQKHSLNREFWSARDSCMRCGRPGHFAKECTNIFDISGDRIEMWECEKCEKEFEFKEECEKHERYCKKGDIVCYRCKRSGHYSTKCYARSDKYGNELY
jgi:predicted GIY-YIG superfamily endonuclease